MKKNVAKTWMSIVLTCAMTATLSLTGFSETTENKAEEVATEAEGYVEGTEEIDPSDFPVAVCMDNMNHPVHRIVQMGFLKKAEELGYTDATVIGTDGNDMSEKYASAEGFAAEGGKGLLMWAGDSSCFETIKSCADQGVIVGTPHFKLQTDDGNYPEGLRFNMACNPVTYGKQIADLMAEALDGKEGSIGRTQNSMNTTENAAQESFLDEWNTLADAGTYDLSKIKVLDVELEGAQVDEAINIILGILQSNSDIIGAFGSCGNSPITWADAASKAGKSDGEIWIAGMDATEGNLDYLEKGKVQALVAQPLYDEAQKTMEYFDNLFRGGEVPMWTDLDAPIVTKDGEGKSGIQYHRDIASEVNEFFQ